MRTLVLCVFVCVQGAACTPEPPVVFEYLASRAPEITEGNDTTIAVPVGTLTLVGLESTGATSPTILSVESANLHVLRIAPAGANLATAASPSGGESAYVIDAVSTGSTMLRIETSDGVVSDIPTVVVAQPLP